MKFKKTIRDIDLQGKILLLRVDYNVPFDSSTGKISDDSRIQATLPTIKYLLDRNAKIILISHRGRPRGYDPSLSLKPIATHLSHILEQPVNLLPKFIIPDIKHEANKMAQSSILMLENIRFHSGEENNDADFAKSLSSLGEYYVNDAFGVSHRSHASITGIPQLIPGFAGLLLEKELISLGKVLNQPEQPLTVIMGGSKVSDKMAVMENLLPLSQNIIVGGGMAAEFIANTGYSVGSSKLEEGGIDLANKITELASKTNTEILLPSDVVVASEINKYVKGKIVDINSVPENMMILDIGPKSIGAFGDTISKSKTILWNGPMGVFEIAEFSKGTQKIANLVGAQTSRGSTTLLGGGSTAEAAQFFDINEQVTHVSTGGGASLTFLEGKELPGLKYLIPKINHP